MNHAVRCSLVFFLLLERGLPPARGQRGLIRPTLLSKGRRVHRTRRTGGGGLRTNCIKPTKFALVFFPSPLGTAFDNITRMQPDSTDHVHTRRFHEAATRSVARPLGSASLNLSAPVGTLRVVDAIRLLASCSVNSFHWKTNPHFPPFSSISLGYASCVMTSSLSPSRGIPPTPLLISVWSWLLGLATSGSALQYIVKCTRTGYPGPRFRFPLGLLPPRSTDVGQGCRSCLVKHEALCIAKSSWVC